MGSKFLKKMAVVAALGLAVAVTNAEAAVKTKSFNANGGTNTVTFLYTGETTQTPVAITAAGSEEWITIKSVTTPLTLVSGKTKIKVVYQVTKRETANADDGTVSLTIGEAAPVVIENVKQAGVACKIRLDSNKSTFEYYGGETTVTYAVPAGCTVDVKADNWFKAVAVEGNNAFTITVPALEGNGKTGKVNLTATATDPTNKSLDKKVHTVLQKKRQGAGTVAIGTPTQILTAEDAQKAAASIKVVGKTVVNSAEGIADISSVVDDSTGSSARAATLLNKSVARITLLSTVKQLGGARAAEIQPVDCEFGSGQITLGSSSFKAEYNKCRNFDTELDGVITGQGGPNSTGGLKGTIKAGGSQPYTVTTYEGSSNTELEKTAIAMTLSFSNLAFGIDDGITYTMTAKGTADSSYDTVAGEGKTFLDVAGVTLDVEGTEVSGTATANGSMRASVFLDDVLVAAEDIRMQDLTVTRNESGDTTTVTVDGTYAINSYPDSKCVDGTYVVDTTTPLTYTESVGVTGGVVKINNATITIGNDGTGTAVLTVGGEPVAVPDINAACAIDN